MSALIRIAAFLATAALSPAALAAEAKAVNDPRLAKLLDAFVDEILADSPETATSLGMDKGVRAPLRRRLSDLSSGGRAKELAGYADRAKRLQAIPRDLVEAAYTLGARDDGIVRRVLLPMNAPEIAEILRLVLGWAWTYVIVAELIGATSGIGHMIMDSQRLLDTGQMIFGIVVIGLIGLVTDFLFKALNRRLFPWAAL